MGDSTRLLTVLLERDMDVQDEVGELIAAIQMIRGVAEVLPGTPNDLESYTARSVAKRELGERIRRVMQVNVNGEWMYELHQGR